MQTAISSDLLRALIEASPEQLAAVARILGCTAQSASAAELEDGEQEPPLNEDVARNAFALLVRLDAGGKFKAPSPLTVFRLYCVDGYSADRVARKCRCAKGTVMSRLRFIEERTGVKAEQFRAMSGHLQQLDDDLRSSGAREIYRRGLADGDD